MPESLQLLAAERTRQGSRNLITLLHTTPPEKLHWKPLDQGRSVLALITECILVNRKWALTLRQGVYARPPAEMLAQIEATPPEVALVQALLEAATEELAAAILALPTAQLSHEITAPFGTYSVAQCCLLGYWNMAYHEGQINYLQTLYGDAAAHAHF